MLCYKPMICYNTICTLLQTYALLRLFISTLIQAYALFYLYIYTLIQIYALL